MLDADSAPCSPRTPTTTRPELRPWRLDGVEGGDLRTAWCRLMGLGVEE